ncbi:MAG: glycerophosphodiester phosphodiesterase [Candidatus Saccharimonadales bacterium]
MKQVIAHRGASGLALENSSTAIQLALKQTNTIIEFDVRLTQDHKLVVCHDANLVKMANNSSKIADYSWADLKDIQLTDGSQLLLLEDVLKMAGKRPLLIEAKDLGSELAIVAAIDKFPQAMATVISFKRPVLLAIKELRPKQKMYVSENNDAIDAIHFAKRHDFRGLALNGWLLSPHVYWLCRRAKLEVFVYTINSRFLVWFIRRLYPGVTICTDFPERFK